MVRRRCNSELRSTSGTLAEDLAVSSICPDSPRQQTRTCVPERQTRSAGPRPVLCLTVGKERARPHPWALAVQLQSQLVACAQGVRCMLIREVPKDARRLIAGAVAGGVSKTATAPIETVRMQLMANSKGNILQVLGAIWEQKGIWGYFSGNSADVLRTMPSKAIELASYDLYKRLLCRHDPTTKHKLAPGPLASTVAAAMAGSSSTMLLFPLETVRTRLAVDSKQYTSILGTFQSIIMNEGPLSLYKGLGTSLLGAIPYTAMRLTLFDGLKWSYQKVTDRDRMPAQATMACGALAGIVATAGTFPLEVVRRRMMMGGPRAYPHAWAALTAVAREEGVSSLYRGLALTCAKQAPSQAITFFCYDFLKGVMQTETSRQRNS